MTKPKDKLRVMKDLDLVEVSLVDSPMQEGARVAIMKRKDGQALKRLALTSMTAGHAHSVMSSSPYGGENRLGQTSYVDGHTHDWIMDEAGNIFIADAQGHNHGIAVLTKSEDPLALAGKNRENTVTADGPAVIVVNNIAGEQTNKAATGGANGNETMTPEQIAALQKQANDSAAKVAELEKGAARAQSILKLSAEQRAHFDTLQPAEQDSFLSASDEQRTQIVKNLRDGNPVVFKALDGTEYRKNDDPRLVKMAQRADESQKTLLREQAIRKQAELEKRATDELPNLGGDVATKAALLGAVESIENEATRTSVLAVIKSHDAGLGKAFQRIGTSNSGNGTGDKASDKLDALAKAHADKNKVTLEKAYDAVLKTDEGRQLYMQARLEPKAQAR